MGIEGIAYEVTREVDKVHSDRKALIQEIIVFWEKELAKNDDWLAEQKHTLKPLLIGSR